MPMTRRSQAAVASNLDPEVTASTTFSGALDKFTYGAAVRDGATAGDATALRADSKAVSTSARSKRQLDVLDEEGVSRTPSPGKKRRRSSKYAPPSKYAHLKGLQDILAPGLIAVFVGFNPGVRTARTGFPYAHPSNLFWKLLHSSGITGRRWRPDEAPKLPEIGLGNTNLVDRPTKDAGELSKDERAAGAPLLAAKIRQYRPEAVCIVGKSIWEDIWRFKYGRNPKAKEFRYGWQDETENMGKLEQGKVVTGEEPWTGARVFVTTSTSGLSASLKPAEKEAIWKPFGDWVQQQRRLRGSPPDHEQKI